MFFLNLIMPKVCVRRVVRSLQLFKEVRRLEVLRHGVIEPRDHLVDGLLPALLRVLTALDSAVELAECLLNHVSEVRRNLKINAFSFRYYYKLAFIERSLTWLQQYSISLLHLCSVLQSEVWSRSIFMGLMICQGPYLNVVVSVVMKIEYSVQFRVSCHV